MSKHVVIVGAGLFGSIAATLAERAGHKVTLIDDKRPFRASAASGCVLAPSWLSSLERNQIDTALGVLNDLYTVHDIEFNTGKLLKFKAQRVDPADVWRAAPKVVQGTVTSVGESKKAAVVALGDKALVADAVLVAAGVWSNALVHMPEVQGLYGASLMIKGDAADALLSVYQPYRQAVGFQIRPGKVWFGDGTALVEKTWEKESAVRTRATQARAAKMFPALKSAMHSITVGARPYVKGHKAGFFHKVSPHVWVSTGGAKNGTVLAAWQAAEFVRSLK